MAKKSNKRKFGITVFCNGAWAAAESPVSKNRIESIVEQIETAHGGTVNGVRQFIKIGSATIRPDSISHYTTEEY